MPRSQVDLRDRGLLEHIFSDTCSSLKKKLPNSMTKVDCDKELQDAVVKPSFEETRP